MSTAKKSARKAKCKYAFPMSNDRAEAFVGPKPEILPKFSEVPAERDKQAFELAAKGWTQRRIAKKLKISQPTVHRGIRKYRLWFGMTLPEDREELVGWARFRVAVEQRRIFLQHQQELAMEEWHESRKPFPMKRKRTKLDPEGQKLDGVPIKDIQIDEWEQRRHASAAHFNAANKRSLELTMLEGGYLGVHQMSCNVAMDPDERNRWDRYMKTREAEIEELKSKLAELEAKLAMLGAGLPTPPTGSTAGLPASGERGDLRPNVSAGSETRAEQPASATQTHESEKAQMAPVMNHTSPDSGAASPVQAAPSGELPDSPRPVSQRLNQVNQEHPRGLPPGHEKMKKPAHRFPSSQAPLGNSRSEPPLPGREAEAELQERAVPSGAWDREPSEPAHEPRAATRRLILESHDSACVPLQESELLEREKDGLAWLAEVGELIATLTPTNEYDTPYRDHLVTLWRNSDRNYHRHGILPERQKLPRLETVRKGRPYTIAIPPDRDKFSRG